jgi:uncharacterized membrane protein
MKFVRNFFFILSILVLTGHLYALIFGGHFSSKSSSGLKGSAFGAAELANDPLGKVFLIALDLFLIYLLVKLWNKKQ